MVLASSDSPSRLASSTEDSILPASTRGNTSHLITNLPPLAFCDTAAHILVRCFEAALTTVMTQPIKYRNVVPVLVANGWTQQRRKSAHEFWTSPEGKSMTIAARGGMVKPATLRDLRVRLDVVPSELGVFGGRL